MVVKDKMNMVKKGEQNFDKEVAKGMIMNYKAKAKKDKFQTNQKGNDNEKDQKKFDFKGKAIAGKKAQIGKQIDKAMGGGPGGGPNSKSNQKYDSFFKTLKHIKKEGLLPSVIFFFNRAAVSQLAIESDDKMSFATDAERVEIKKFKKNAL